MILVWVFILAYIVISIVGICSIYLDTEYLGENMTWGSAVPLFICVPVLLIAVGVFMTVCANRFSKNNQGSKNSLFTETTTVVNETRVE